MEERNLDLGIPLERDQWEQIGRRAAALGQDVAGLEWAADTERVLVYLTDEAARGLWNEYVSAPESYGSDTLEVAEFVYNDGRPYAHVEVPENARPPAILPQEMAAMQEGLERYVREKWDLLLRESGIHYERGHISPDVD